jgi:hypothetical protein
MIHVGTAASAVQPSVARRSFKAVLSRSRENHQGGSRYTLSSVIPTPTEMGETTWPEYLAHFC